ncbi:MAG: hypothetical protein QGG40_21650, partial [Myxococcota bacterium]|nr:hypothetical protein [Myxococcota bacterium]
MRLHPLWMITLGWFVAGCGPKIENTANGTVDGTSLNVQSAWWGGPFMILLNQEFDCIDMSWVDRYYGDGEAPLEDDLVALQFTFSEEEVDDGYYDVTGEAAVTARFLVNQSGGF